MNMGVEPTLVGHNIPKKLHVTRCTFLYTTHLLLWATYKSIRVDLMYYFLSVYSNLSGTIAAICYRDPKKISVHPSCRKERWNGTFTSCLEWESESLWHWVKKEGGESVGRQAEQTHSSFRKTKCCSFHPRNI